MHLSLSPSEGPRWLQPLSVRRSDSSGGRVGIDLNIAFSEGQNSVENQVSGPYQADFQERKENRFPSAQVSPVHDAATVWIALL